MTSCEIVRSTIDFAGPSRLAFDYYAYGRRFTDISTSYLDAWLGVRAPLVVLTYCTTSLESAIFLAFYGLEQPELIGIIW